MKNSNNWVISIAVVAVVCFGSWLMGFDFNERGSAAMWTFLTSLWMPMFVLSIKGTI